MAKMNNDDLRALVEAQHFAALGATDASALSSDRARAMEYYRGDVTRDIPSEDGKSTAVSMDVSDTVEGLMPQLMEIFCGTDEVVQFDPVGPDDVGGAQQETDYVNHVFMNRNPGFMVLYQMIKDALLQKVGVVKVWWEKHERIERETYTDKTDDEYALIAAAPDVEIVEHTEKEDPNYPGMKFHDVTVETKKDYSCARVMGVPPEEFGTGRDTRSSLQEANYCYHKVVTNTVSDLIREGYDEDQVRSLPTYRLYTNQEELARDTVNEHQYTPADINDADRFVEVTEHYIRVDMEGNGRAELYRIVTGGGSLPGSVGEILNLDGKPDVQPWDAMPFAAITPVPMPHRFFGRSVADLVIDIMKIKTAMLRGALDNIYLSLRPRPVVAEQLSGPNTIDDLLVHRAGAIVRVKQQGAVEWQVVPDIAQNIYPALEYFDAVREWRTGVTKAGQGIDANALQNQSATAVNQVYDAAQSKVKLLARIFAETGIRDLFMLLHATIKKHADKPQVVRLRNQWVPVDPRNWKTRDDLTINIGLGTGRGRNMEASDIEQKLIIAGDAFTRPADLLCVARVLEALDHLRLEQNREVVAPPRIAEGHAFPARRLKQDLVGVEAHQRRRLGHHEKPTWRLGRRGREAARGDEIVSGNVCLARAPSGHALDAGKDAVDLVGVPRQRASESVDILDGAV